MSCDPTYPISIYNSRKDTVTIVAKTTIDFNSDELDYKVLGGPYNQKVIEFKMAPETILECGMAIAEIDDDMPFSEFKVFSKNDTIVAKSQAEILDLFDKNRWGSLETPYQLTIK
ncbi:MAG: hypothetical protein IT258_12990 [Saprospiraceae bacterium]|nr:hypothetical protein [Saprospiraceae bacterium]